MTRLRFAYSLASALGASIDILHVIDTSDTMLDRAADRPAGGDPAATEHLLREFVTGGRIGLGPDDPAYRAWRAA